MFQPPEEKLVEVFHQLRSKRRFQDVSDLVKKVMVASLKFEDYKELMRSYSVNFSFKSLLSKFVGLIV